MSVVINLKNERDLNVVLPILKELKIAFTTKITQSTKTSSKQKAREKLYKLLENNAVDVSYYGDPIAFQKEQRKDKTLPNRD